jgi:hypothetical protein
MGKIFLKKNHHFYIIWQHNLILCKDLYYCQNFKCIILIKETLSVPSIGKIITPVSPGFFNIRNFLIDQSGTSGGGGVMPDILYTNLAQNSTYEIRIKPHGGKRFQVNVPPQTGVLKPSVFFYLNLGRIVIPNSDTNLTGAQFLPNNYIFGHNALPAYQNSNATRATVKFLGLECSSREPVALDNWIGYYQDAIGIYFTAFSFFYGITSFDEILIEGGYGPTSSPSDVSFCYYPAEWVFPGILVFTPSNYPRVMFQYSTNTIIDSGEFVRIV